MADDVPGVTRGVAEGGDGSASGRRDGGCLAQVRKRAILVAPDRAKDNKAKAALGITRTNLHTPRQVSLPLE